MDVNYKLPTKNCFFPTQEEPIYDPNDFVADYQFKEYWKREKDRCINGFHLADGQVFIPGHLYFHCVYWKIAMYKGKTRLIDTPILRDVDWIVFNDFEECLKQGKFYALVGSRDWGKSIISASRIGWTYTFFKNSECVVSAGAEDYNKLATDKIEDGLTNLHPYWKKQRLASDWKKEVKAGWKDRSSNQPHPKSSNSKIIVRNYQNGTNSMAANGTRPQVHLVDEIGTIQNLIACVKDSDGCWWSGDSGKPSCLSIFTGTGGNAEVGAEAGEIFFTPEGYNILSFDNPETGGKMGRFISALKSRMQYKDKKSLGEYLGIQHPDLDNIFILVSDEERAYDEWWLPQFEAAKKSGNSKTVLKFKAYWPLKASDSFLVLSSNNYNTEAAKVQQTKLKEVAIENDGFIGTPIELFYDGESIKHKISKKMPVTQFPVRDQDTDCPIMIYEFPIPDAPWGLYIAGVDPYKQDKADSSDSLGAVYIYKRMHSIHGEGYQDMFVASYVSRPPKQEQWLEQARLLIKYYNAFTLSENEDMVFIRYMQNKGDDYLLADTPEFIKDIVPNSTVNRGKGVHAYSKIINFFRASLKNYLDEVIHITESGQEILGVSRVKDILLLDEIIKFRKDGNFDRERAASLAIGFADKMSPIGKIGEQMSDPRYKSLFKKTEFSKPQLFEKRAKSFSPKRQRLFR